MPKLISNCIDYVIHEHPDLKEAHFNVDPKMCYTHIES